MDSGSRTDTPDSEYLEILKSLVPPSQADCVNGDTPSLKAEIPAAPPEQSHGGQWKEPTDAFAIQVAEYFNVSTTCRSCRSKGTASTLVFCAGCGPARKPIHRACLRREPEHEPPDTTQQDCREVSFKAYVFMRWLFDVGYLDESDIQHIDDTKATWIGVPHDQPEAAYPQLYIWNRLRSLVSEAADAPQRQHPSLVSFVSPTGSGKSTLIRALIRMLEPVAFLDFDAPVPGGIDDLFVSTSSDIHLYSDPRTRLSKTPLYFADCEGLSGSDDPVARRVISKAFRVTASRGSRSETVGSGKPTPADRIAYHLETASHRENLRWGRLTYPVPPNSQGERGFRKQKSVGQVDSVTRRLIVSQLYPRLLYAFSDVVCFVQNNTRDGQNMFSTLFDWARQGHEKTLNQRVRPGLIIILNKSTELAHDALGTPEQATRRMLDAYAKSSRFKDMQRMWEKRGHQVKNAEDLIHCYYYAFKVVSIPTYTSSPPVASQMMQALRGLYAKIREMSECIRKKRRPSNMEPDVSNFNSYVEYAGKKLARDYKAAVDFHHMQASSGDSSLPTTFSEHLVQLMSRMVGLRRLDKSDKVGGEAQLVEDMIPFIASCVVAQVAETGSGDRMRQTRILADEARVGLQQFRDESWRCEAVDSATGRRCRNYWEGHEKGHQFQSLAAGEDTLAVGQHESTYDGDKYMALLWDEIHSMSNESLDGNGAAKRKLADAAQAVGVNRVESQRTCLSCLSNCPTNTLPCQGVQHSVCKACIRRYMSGHGSSWAHITQCPLGCRLSVTPWRIREKPERAGSRLLSLDGGGVRGIVELKLLARIEEEVGFGIKIQDLFDLVIGTSTGGIVALGVFEKGWTLTEATRMFRDLASRAFEFRRALKIPLYSSFAVPFCSFKYKTAGIVTALQESFGNDFLFGQPRGAAVQPPASGGNSTSSSQDQVKVGVVACLEGRYQPCLIANYSRNPLSCGTDQDILQREDEQEKDFRTWQAARATSAAQTFFKPYYHEGTRRLYVDGAIVRNNPVRVVFDESQSIWPSCRPDIIVSLGTGIMVDKDGEHALARNAVLDSLKAVVPARLRKLAETGLSMVESTLDCQREWDDFRHSHSFDPQLRKNLHRIDVGITNTPPKIDAVDEIGTLMDACDKYLASGGGGSAGSDVSTAQKLKRVARRLRASLFCFSESLRGHMEGGVVKGTIHCRLSAHSEGASSLLASGPVFRLREGVGPGRDETFGEVRLLTQFDPATLSVQVRFRVSPGDIARSIDVNIATRGPEWEPISGF